MLALAIRTTYPGFSIMKAYILAVVVAVLVLGIVITFVVPNWPSVVEQPFRKERAVEARRHAVAALGEQGKSAVPALIEALHDEDPGIRAVAGGALGRLR